MKALKRKGEESPSPQRAGAVASIDSSEFRAIMIGAAVLAVFLYWIKLILMPFVLAAIVAYVCAPLLDWAARRTGWPRLVFVIGLFVLFCAVGLGLGGFAAERIVGETRATASDLQAMLEKFTRQALGDQPVHLFGLTMNAHDMVKSVIDRMRDWFINSNGIEMTAGYSVALIMGGFLTVVLLFYFLADGRRVAAGMLWIVPPQRRALVARIWKRLDPVLMRYFIGMIGVVAYAAVAAYVGLGVILGIKHAILLALLTGILEVLPVIGPTAAAVIAGLVALRTATGVDNIFEYALYATLLRLSIDQLVGPVVLGRAAHVHPVLIIFCFLAGGVVLGVPGVILAVPFALVVKATLATLYGDE
jgi:predicted PurR-regulated permease PerM